MRHPMQYFNREPSKYSLDVIQSTKNAHSFYTQNPERRFPHHTPLYAIGLLFSSSGNRI